MRLLVFILILTIGVQPLQAGSCDMEMEESPQTSHHMDMTSPQSHDCCDTKQSESTENCETGMDCGMCFVSVSAIPDIPRIYPVWNKPVYRGSSSGIMLPSHSSPPFRPPIA